MAFRDLMEDEEREELCFPCGAGEEEEPYDAQDDLTEALTLLEDCRELLITLLDPHLWEARYVTKFIKREIGKLEAEILAFTDQWNIPEKGEEGKG